MTISLQTTIGELASAIPHAARVFEAHRIDYCCGGRRNLGDACAKVGVNPTTVIAELEAPARDVGEQIDWREAPLGTLAQHILDVHHTFMWQELPRIEQLMKKVARVHGEAHPELLEMSPVVLGMVDELNMHLLKEERVLFPYIQALAVATGPVSGPFGTVLHPISMMNAEHEDAGEALETIHRLSNQLRAPEDACGSYRALYAALAAVELDLHQHIHLESNVLFPRALELEQILNSSSARG